jgi:SAM-dependent methyltransferase/uncharacterized protein YbaR (Trm112 family)
MYLRLLDFLRCPDCGDSLALTSLSAQRTAGEDEITEGLLNCDKEHWFPIVRGIPRMLPDSLEEHWPTLELLVPSLPTELLQQLTSGRRGRPKDYDRRTRSNFTEEWSFHDVGGRTWGFDLEAGVKAGFIEPTRLPEDNLRGMVVLDAGCGSGSQSVAYTKLGLEVLALDLSSGLEQGHAFRSICAGADPSKVHFIQGDVLRPPLARESVDVIHSSGVLHHTPNTLNAFRALTPLLKPGGTFYVYLYTYEPFVTPLVNTIRAVTTRIPSHAFARISKIMAVPFVVFCRTVNALGIRAYPSLSRREGALALMDIFGAPYAHYHSYEEVEAWYRAEGFTEVWNALPCRRGFGACGRLASDPATRAGVATVGQDAA